MTDGTFKEWLTPDKFHPAISWPWEVRESSYRPSSSLTPLSFSHLWRRQEQKCEILRVLFR